MRRRTQRAALGLAAVPVVAAIVIGIQVQLARWGPDLPDDTPIDHDGRIGGPGPALRMVWLGDSTAAGVGATAAELAMPQRVAVGLDRPVGVVSLAVSGARVADVLDDQIQDLDRLQPDVVVVSVGANDAVHLTSRDSFRADLRRLVAATPDRALLVLLGVPDMGAPPRMAQPLRALAGWRGRQLEQVSAEVAAEAAAREAGAVYVDIAAATGPTMRSDTGRYFAADRYHPSDDGYALWAEAVLDRLAGALPVAPSADRIADEEVADAHR